MKKLLFSCLFMAIVTLGGCNKEEGKLSPSNNPTGEMVSIDAALNQGTKIYNEKIGSFFEKYDCLMLYDFPAGAISYNGSSVDNRIYYTPAKEEYVGDIFAFYEVLSKNFDKSWEAKIYPRHIFVVDTIATQKSPKVMLWAYSSSIAKLILGGAGEKSIVEFLKDKPYPENLTSLTNMQASARARVSYRYKLFFDLFYADIKSGKVKIPETFKKFFGKIDAKVYNALSVTGKGEYLKENGYIKVTSQTTSLQKYYALELDPISNKPPVSNAKLVTGDVLGEKEYEEMVSAEFFEYISDVFKFGIEALKTSSQLPTTKIVFAKYPKMIEVLDVILENSKKDFGVDLKVLLSEDLLSIPADEK